MTDLATELRDIERKLFEIPDEKVAQLTLLIERSRAVALSASIADAALGTLRPRLARTRPPRHLTLQRIFCHPFEDLLVLGHEKSFGRVRRASLAGSWDYVVSRLDKAAVKELEGALRGEAMPSIGMVDDPRIPRLGPTLWAIAAKKLRAELALAEDNSEARAKLVADLGSEAALEDLADICAALELAEPLEKMRVELSPKPVGRLLADQAEALKEALTGILSSGKPRPGIAIAIALARMSDGFQLLPLIDALGELPTGITDLMPGAYARRILAADSKRFFATVTQAEPAAVADSKVADMVDDFVRLVGRLKADGMADGPQPEMEAASGRLQQMVKTGVLGDADKLVLGGVTAALAAPADAGGDAEAAKKAAFEAKLGAENRVYALHKVARVAADIGVDKDVAQTLKTLTQQVEETGVGLVAEIKAGKLNGEGKEAVKAKLYAAVRMLELVGGQQNAGKLMKDGLTAIDKMPK